MCLSRWRCFSSTLAFLSLLCRVAVLDKVTDFLLFLGKLLITGGVGEFLVTCILWRDVNGVLDEKLQKRQDMISHWVMKNLRPSYFCNVLHFHPVCVIMSCNLLMRKLPDLYSMLEYKFFFVFFLSPWDVDLHITTNESKRLPSQSPAQKQLLYLTH